jgi:GNAT superfamily N-acetyltransferase
MNAVFTLVHELAVYEKAGQEVSTTPVDYVRDCFEEDRFAVIVAEDIDVPEAPVLIGMALTYWAYSTWKGKYLWLEDLIVTEKYRGKGIGKLLFDAVVKKAVHEGANLLRWQVLDWNEPAIQFYNTYPVQYQNEWLTCKLSGEEMQQIVKK